jgi:N-acetylglucosaminyldiphosphoundecaprenol N-acetyl-beta-D-mannosaminyltransferase
METREVSGDDSKLGGMYWQIWGLSLFGRGGVGVLNLVREKLALGQKKYWIATVNPEFVMAAQNDAGFKALLNRTSLNVVDGVGLVWARRVLAKKTFFDRLSTGFGVGLEVLAGRYSEEIAAGSVLMDKLGEMANKNGLRVYFLGGWEDRALRTAGYFNKKYPALAVESSPGRPTETDDKVIAKINRFEPDLLFVAYGMKSQEEWISRNLVKLKVGVVMGVGRSFNYYSGDVRRAPGWVSRMGLEWLYSLVKEPGERFKRQLVLPKFVWKVLTDRQD